MIQWQQRVGRGRRWNTIGSNQNILMMLNKNGPTSNLPGPAKWRVEAQQTKVDQEAQKANPNQAYCSTVIF